MESDEAKDLEAKYSFLLKPIKDFAQIWRIDISKLVDEFIEETKRTEGDSRQFASGATLLQGVTSVYSRKVDCVLEEARELANQLGSGDVKSTSEKASGANQTEGEGRAPRAKDHLEDWEQKKYWDNPCHIFDFKNYHGGNWEDITLPFDEPIDPTANLQPPIPMAFVPLADYEKSGVKIYSSDGHLIGDYSDLMINTCYVDEETGCLLFDKDYKKLIDKVTKDVYAVSKVNNANEVVIAPADVLAFTAEECKKMMSENGNIAELQASAFVELHRDAPDLGVSVATHLQNENGTDVGEDETLTDANSSYSSDSDGWISQSAFPLMDFFEEVPLHDHPIQIKEPINFDKVMERRVKKYGPSGHPEMTLSDILNPCFGKTSKKSWKKGVKEGEADDDIEQAMFGEYIEREKKRRAKERAELQKDGLPSKQGDKGERVWNAEGVAGDSTDVEEDTPDEDSDTYRSGEDEDGAIAELPKLFDLLDDDAFSCPFKNTVGTEVSHTMQHETLETIKGKSYAEQLKWHLEKYWNEGAKAESKIGERVRKWEETLQPLLDEEEKRPKFDIAAEKAQMLKKFEKEGDVKSIVDLTEPTSSYGVARAFMTSLVLANESKIEFVMDERSGSASRSDATDDGDSDGESGITDSANHPVLLKLLSAFSDSDTE